MTMPAITNAKESFQKTTGSIAEYVARTCDYGAEYRLLALLEITEPDDPKENATTVQIKNGKSIMSNTREKKAARQVNHGKYLTIILGQ